MRLGRDLVPGCPIETRKEAFMSTADLDIFGPPEATDPHPRFNTVLRGLDPDQVRDHLGQLLARIDELERALGEAEAGRDAARRRYASAREDAYAQVAGQVADLLRAADQQAEKLRREAGEEATRRVAESKQLADQIQREAEDEADRLRREGEDTLLRAKEETERVLGGLTSRREGVMAEIRATRDHLQVVLQQLDDTMTLQHGAEVIEATDASTRELGRLPTDLEANDLLDLSEGFDLVLPDFQGEGREEDAE
jgi:cell division septum initiation protein DivIVA